MKRIFNLFFLAVFVFSGCDNGSKTRETSPKAAAENKTEPSFQVPQPGIIAAISSEKNARLSFSIYLPKAYESSSEYPVIYFFDSQARGELPLEMYKQWADDFGYILTGSNYSKNGLDADEYDSHFRQWRKALEESLNIAPERTYLYGFSGGAKVATSMALTAKNIAGITACGAVQPFKSMPGHEFTYLIMVGKADFNYASVASMKQSLEQQGVKHELIAFNGKHEWPPQDAMRLSFVWNELNAMRKGKMQLDKQRIMTWYREDENYITANASNPLDFHRQYQRMISYYEGLADVSSYRDAVKRLENTERYQRAVEFQQEIFQEEAKRKRYYLQGSQDKSLNWWKDQVTQLKKSAEGPYSELSALSDKRILGFLGLAMYMQSRNEVLAGHYPEAFKYLSIYEMLEPQNPEHAYLRAKAYAQQNKAEQSLKNLLKAVELGFENAERLKQDKSFDSIRKHPQYSELLGQLEGA